MRCSSSCGKTRPRHANRDRPPSWCETARALQVGRVLTPGFEIVIDGLAGLLRQFESDGPVFLWRTGGGIGGCIRRKRCLDSGRI
jgi:hypothetical protein